MKRSPEEVVDWKWDEPLYPLVVFGGLAAGIARMGRTYRCAHCGWEIMGSELIMITHMMQKHPGSEGLYTAYPISYGFVGAGRDW